MSSDMTQDANELDEDEAMMAIEYVKSSKSECRSFF
jgi:hypothetical protein